MCVTSLLAALEGETEVVYPSRLETFAQRLARDGEAMAALVGLTVNDLAELAEMPFPDAVQQAQEKVTRAWTQARRHCIEANAYAFQLCEGDDRFHWVLLPWEISAVCARIACDLCPVAYGSIQVHTYAYSSFVAYTCLDSNFLMHTAAM